MKVVAIWHGRSWRRKGLPLLETVPENQRTVYSEWRWQPQSALADERRTPRL